MSSSRSNRHVSHAGIPRVLPRKFAMLLLFAVLLQFLFRETNSAAAAEKLGPPNIVLILADDLGYGDVQILNPSRGKIATPHLDRLAKQGMIFTDAHSGSSVCTPTRYGLLTGRYAWRTSLQSGVLQGYSPPLIAENRLTVATFLKQNGYSTACLGKWHLGMHWAKRDPKEIDENESKIDFTKPIARGPTTVGFDRYFGISASLDMPPYVWIDNDRTAGLPTVKKKWLREGLAHPDFEAIDVLPRLTTEAIAYFKDRANDARTGKPFFLYLPLASPHTPILPTRDWQGKSGLGDYGDFVMQTDAAVGEILKSLDDLQLASNTLVIFTSDNGCSPAAKTEDLEKHGHFASERSRGYKADLWDGGHRVPFLVRWPEKVRAGSTCDGLVCLTDFFATCGDILNVPLPETAAEDSFSFLPALLGKPGEMRRASVVHHSITGRFALREAKWKLNLAPGSGGWSAPRDPAAKKQGLPETQLYDMQADPGERENLAGRNAEEVSRLTKVLEEVVDRGRSTPGPIQKNDVAVKLHKAAE